MDNAQYASILDDVASLLDIKGANRFRVRAFENAAQTLRRLADDVDDCVERDALESIDGIGESIADDIRQIYETGTCEVRTELLEELDPGLLDILDLQGLGPKRIATLYEELDIASIEALREAAETGRIQEIDGFGPKTQENILSEIERLADRSGRTPLPAARRIAESFRNRLADHDAVERIDVAGSLRRGRVTIGDIDLLVATHKPESVADAFVDAPEIDEVMLRGEAKVSTRLVDGIQVDLRLVDPEVFGAALHYFTGSKQHHVQLRTRAKKDGYKISEYGVFEIGEEDEPVAARTEEAVFGALGLDYVPPELREGTGEIEAAAEGTLPAPIELDDLRGDLHMHTTASDGSAGIREMAREARDRGLDYIAITDHSQAVSVADGLTAEQLEAHVEAIREADDDVSGIRILAGIEVDILEEGELDMDDSLLAACDWVVGSIHRQFDLDEATMTERLVRPITSGLISAVGHPTGRILGGRDGYDYDDEMILEAARDSNVALEINGSEGRLDLDAERARRASEAKVELFVGSDAHSTRGFDALSLGIQQARRAWLTADDVLNTRSVEELLEAVPPA